MPSSAPGSTKTTGETFPLYLERATPRVAGRHGLGLTGGWTLRGLRATTARWRFAVLSRPRRSCSACLLQASPRRRGRCRAPSAGVVHGASAASSVQRPASSVQRPAQPASSPLVPMTSFKGLVYDQLYPTHAATRFIWSFGVRAREHATMYSGYRNVVCKKNPTIKTNVVAGCHPVAVTRKSTPQHAAQAHTGTSSQLNKAAVTTERTSPSHNECSGSRDTTIQTAVASQLADFLHGDDVCILSKWDRFVVRIVVVLMAQARQMPVVVATAVRLYDVGGGSSLVGAPFRLASR